MKKLLLFALLIQSIITVGQDFQKEIDEQIWTKFTEAWETNNGAAYNAIHSDDVWRINPGRLLIGNEYKERNLERMQGQETNSIIEFSFETRTSNQDNAYEVGYYRITSNGAAEPNYFVGRFHVALKKIDGIWKITQDWDTSEINGVSITPESVATRNFIYFK